MVRVAIVDDRGSESEGGAKEVLQCAVVLTCRVVTWGDGDDRGAGIDLHVWVGWWGVV